MCPITFICIVTLFMLILMLYIILLLCSTFVEYSSLKRLQVVHIAGWCYGAGCVMPNALFRYVVAWVLTYGI
jgi:hypothetical protein